MVAALALQMLSRDLLQLPWLEVLPPDNPAARFVLFALLAFAAALLLRRRGSSAAGEQPAVTGVHLYRRSQPQFRRELARVRRYGRTLAILVLRTEPHPPRTARTDCFSASNDTATRRVLDRLLASSIGAVLGDCLRDSDIATYDAAGDQYVVLLAESGRSQAEQAARRLWSLIEERTGARVRAGIAAFPADGLVLEDLVSEAEADCVSGTERIVASSPATTVENILAFEHHDLMERKPALDSRG